MKSENRLSLQRAERLKSRKEIERLFGGAGKSFAQYPLRLIYRRQEQRGDTPIQISISVPKRRFKRAVQRNRLRRRIREAYRRSKWTLYNRMGEQTHTYSWMLLYIGKEEYDFETIDRAMRGIIRRFIKYGLS